MWVWIGIALAIVFLIIITMASQGIARGASDVEHGVDLKPKAVGVRCFVTDVPTVTIHYPGRFGQPHGKKVTFISREARHVVCVRETG